MFGTCLCLSKLLFYVRHDNLTRGNFNNRKTAYLNNRWDLGDARSTQQHGTLSPRMRRIAGSLWVKF